MHREPGTQGHETDPRWPSAGTARLDGARLCMTLGNRCQAEPPPNRKLLSRRTVSALSTGPIPSPSMSRSALERRGEKPMICDPIGYTVAPDQPTRMATGSGSDARFQFESGACRL